MSIAFQNMSECLGLQMPSSINDSQYAKLELLHSLQCSGTVNASWSGASNVNISTFCAIYVLFKITTPFVCTQSGSYSFNGGWSWDASPLASASTTYTAYSLSKGTNDGSKWSWFVNSIPSSCSFVSYNGTVSSGTFQIYWYGLRA